MPNYTSEPPQRVAFRLFVRYNITMINIGLLFLYYFIAYAVVTLIGILHTIFNIKVLHYRSMKESPGMGEAYEKTKPFHVLYNIIIFPFFAWLYLNSLSPLTIESALWLSLIWGTITVILDLVGWVLIKHPWSLSFKEFYIDYQPWITLIYLTIYTSPFISYGIIHIF